MRGGRGEPGRLTGGTRRCTLEGCRGERLGVRWPDGRITWPCSEGLFIREDGQYQIYGCNTEPTNGKSENQSNR